MNVILSIKPHFAEKIFKGTKQYEFRRVIFKDPNVKTVIVYASSPVKKVIGQFEIEFILKDYVSALWQKTKSKSGITEEYFYEYFQGKDEGYAIKIKKTKRYRNPKCIKEHYNALPPQSYAYLIK